MAEYEGDMDFGELLEEYMDHEKMYHLEGEQGVLPPGHFPVQPPSFEACVQCHWKRR